MISIFILVSICLTADAKPNPLVGSYAVDGVQGVLYEVPEYEDPDLAMLQLTAMGVMPVLTVLQDVVDPSDGDDATSIEFNDVKKSLDGIIGGLELARSKFEEGSTNIDTDIDKSVANLMKLKHQIKVNANSASSLDQHVSQSDEYDKISRSERVSTQVPTTVASSDFILDIPKIAGDAIMVSESGKQLIKHFLKLKHHIQATVDTTDPFDDQESPVFKKSLAELSLYKKSLAESSVDEQPSIDPQSLDDQVPSVYKKSLAGSSIDEEPSIDPQSSDDQDASESFASDNHQDIEYGSETMTDVQSTPSSEISAIKAIIKIKTLGDGLVVKGLNKYEDLEPSVYSKKKSWKSSKDE